jgi:hypothetical protein
MKMTVLKIVPTKSKYGKEFFYIFLKGDNGGSFKTCAYPSFGNFLRNHWNEVVQKGIGTVLDYGAMPINTKGLVSADIAFKILPKEVLNEATV